MAGTRIFRIIDRTPVFNHSSSDGNYEESSPVDPDSLHTPGISPGGDEDSIQSENVNMALHHTDVATLASSPLARPQSYGGKAPLVDGLLGEIRLERVTFAYPARPEAPIITNLSWIVPAGMNGMNHAPGMNQV